MSVCSADARKLAQLQGVADGVLSVNAVLDFDGRRQRLALRAVAGRAEVLALAGAG